MPQNTLPLHKLNPSNPELLQHVYGMVNGMLLTASLMLLMAAFSYLRKSHLKTRDQKSMSFCFFLMAAGFLMFLLYNLYYQEFSGAVSTLVISDTFFILGKYTAPIGLILVTYITLLGTGIKSYKAFQFQQSFSWYIKGLYTINVLGFAALFYIDNPINTSLLILLLFIPHSIGAAVYCFIGLRDIVFSVSMGIIFSIATAGTYYYSWLTYTRSLNVSPELIAATHFLSALSGVVLAFICLRYGYDEAKRYIKIKNLDHLHLISQFKEALNNDEFYLDYQPQLNISSNKIIGVEALIRWNHPEHGVITPDNFIHLAEETELIDDLCRRVIDLAIKKSRQLNKKNLDLKISINFSAKNLKPSIIDYLTKALEREEVDAQKIVIEITESSVIKDEGETKVALEMLSEMKSILSLDDYGTGFSSLSHINKLPFKELKIDRSFVSDIDTNRDNYKIVLSTISMANSLDLKVVAEGIENTKVLNQLRTMGCDIAQGYHIAKPLAAHQLTNWVKEFNEKT